MILHFAPGGRLGNQLFEVAFIETVRRRTERVFCTRLGAALRTLAGMRGYLNLDSHLFARVMNKFIEPAFDRLTKSRLISSIVEGEEGSIVSKRGLLPVTYVRGYFQGADYPESLEVPMRLRRRDVEAARSILLQAGHRTPLFVHVRRGDFLTTRVRSSRDPSLPISYYRAAVDRLLSEVKDPYFLFLGDEPEWAADAFGHLPRAPVLRRSAPVDLALMSLCDGGIVSASTFAWWGAFLCAGGSPIVAPRYWLGWRLCQWVPPRIAFRRLQFIDVT
jgi:hypothetical protein